MPRPDGWLPAAARGRGRAPGVGRAAFGADALVAPAGAPSSSSPAQVTVTGACPDGTLTTRLRRRARSRPLGGAPRHLGAEDIARSGASVRAVSRARPARRDRLLVRRPQDAALRDDRRDQPRRRHVERRVVHLHPAGPAAGPAVRHLARRRAARSGSPSPVAHRQVERARRRRDVERHAVRAAPATRERSRCRSCSPCRRWPRSRSAPTITDFDRARLHHLRGHAVADDASRRCPPAAAPTPSAARPGAAAASRRRRRDALARLGRRVNTRRAPCRSRAVASAPALQCVSSRRAPASTRRPCSPISRHVSRSSAWIRSASSSADPPAATAAATRRTAQARLTAVGRAAASSAAGARAYALAQREHDAEGAADADRRRAPHDEPQIAATTSSSERSRAPRTARAARSGRSPRAGRRRATDRRPHRRRLTSRSTVPSPAPGSRITSSMRFSIR